MVCDNSNVVTYHEIQANSLKQKIKSFLLYVIHSLSIAKTPLFLHFAIRVLNIHYFVLAKII